MAEVLNNVLVTTVPSVESLELNVFRTNGVLNANFEDLENALDLFLDGYRMVQYSDNADESIKQMRGDRAELNRLSAAIKNKKKEVKDEYMKPLNDFNSKADRLLEKIEEPKLVIDEKIKELEEAGREAKRLAIREFYEKISVSVEADFKEELYKRLYNPSWENASSTQKAYKEGLKKGVDEYTYGMQCLRLSNHEFLEDGIREFKLTLDLSKAISTMEDKLAQKQEFLRNEQERMAAEKARIEAEAKAEAQRQIDAANAEAQRKIDAATQKAEEEAQKKIDDALEKMVAETEENIKKAVAKATAEIEATVKAETDKTATNNVTLDVVPAPTVYVPQTVPKTAPATPVAPTQSVTSVTDKKTVTITFNANEWPAIQKYADRMGVKYTVN